MFKSNSCFSGGYSLCHKLLTFENTICFAYSYTVILSINCKYDYRSVKFKKKGKWNCVQMFGADKTVS